MVVKRCISLLLIAVAVLWTLAATGGRLQMVNAGAHSDMGCNMCHVPHNATGDNTQVPLWNPQHASTTLTGRYTSPTMDAVTTAPDGASKLCLSCHDGSYPMGDEHKFGPNPQHAMGSLENSHPISFVYDLTLAETDGALVDPRTLPRDVLDGQGKMQCTSCHDVHVQAVDQDKFLRWGAYDPAVGGSTSGFCNNCHIK